LNELGGEAAFTFKVLKDIDSLYLDAKNFQHSSIAIDNFEAKEHFYDGKQIIVREKFKANSIHTLYVRWITFPNKAIYSVNRCDSKQIWTQGQGKYTSNWLPSLDDTNDKIEFDISITFDKDYEVISNGKLTDKQVNDSTATWHYDMQNPMSSYLVALVIGKYDKKVEYSKSGIPLEMYYYPEDSAKVEPTYRYTKQMFDFLEEEIGVPFPWQNYKQVPVHDFLYAGMENTSCTIFSDAYMVDDIAFIDKNYVNVNAHELAHQWFGDLVTAKSGEHHWLQEGFATYYALLAERNVFGDDYYYWRLYEYAQELQEQDKAGQSTSLLNPKSSSLTFYKKGAWVLHVLREKVGDEAFKTAVKNYLNKHKFGNVETNDFISEVENASGMDLSEFVEKWLVSTELPIDDMRVALEKNETSAFLKTIEEQPCLSYRTDDNGYIPSSLTMQLPDVHFSAKVEILKELLAKPNYPTYDDLIKEAFQSKDIKLRQAIAQNLTEIPLELKTEYESLLDDKSYITIETALYNLWNNFPEDRVMYLDKTKNIIGFNDKNVRMLWLVLALSTPDYQPEQSQDFYNELVSYINPIQGFETRLKAFEYLLMTGSCNTACHDNLKAATKHHNWRLAKFAKDQLKQFEKN
jgi:aminopeptidase N